MGGALEGVRILDLTQGLAGPFCTMLMADLGADVVKVESPEGDPTRAIGPFTADDDLQAYGGYFQSVNRNKRSISLDLKDPADVATFRALAREAEVLVENFRPDVMERLGLSYESLAADNDRLVYLAMRGFGDARTGESPYTPYPAFDIVAQAMAGMLSITGTADGEPIKTGPGIGDIYTGTLAAVGGLAALLAARATGRGQFVDVAMYDAILALCERIVYQHSYTGAVPAPQGNTHPLLCPFDVFRSKDGHFAIAASTDKHWRLLCGIMDRPDLAADPSLATNRQRVAQAERVRGAVAGWVAERPNAVVMDALAGHVPGGPVQDVEAIEADPHVRAREMIVEVEQPGSARPVRITGSPVKFTRTPSAVRRRAPLLDEDRAGILADWSRKDGS
jgi:crotonobetainyl-CoA:carnitine CoA-transferase CaiB-like acyl-CoA transferase